MDMAQTAPKTVSDHRHHLNSVCDDPLKELPGGGPQNRRLWLALSERRPQTDDRSGDCDNHGHGQNSTCSECMKARLDVFRVARCVRFRLSSLFCARRDGTKRKCRQLALQIDTRVAAQLCLSEWHFFYRNRTFNKSSSPEFLFKLLELFKEIGASLNFLKNPKGGAAKGRFPWKPLKREALV